MAIPEVTRRYVDTFARRDVQGCVKCFGPDGTYSDPGTQGPISGAAIEDQFRILFDAFPDAATETVSLDAISEAVTCWRWIIRGTNTGLFRGMPATGRKVELLGCEFIEARGESIYRVEGYFDRLALLSQLGPIPAPAGSPPR